MQDAIGSKLQAQPSHTFFADQDAAIDTEAMILVAPGAFSCLPDGNLRLMQQGIDVIDAGLERLLQGRPIRHNRLLRRFVQNPGSFRKRRVAELAPKLRGADGAGDTLCAEARS